MLSSSMEQDNGDFPRPPFSPILALAHSSPPSSDPPPTAIRNSALNSSKRRALLHSTQLPPTHILFSFLAVSSTLLPLGSAFFFHQSRGRPLSPSADVSTRPRGSTSPRIPRQLASTAGPCSRSSRSVEVFREADFAKRLRFPPTQTVVLYVRNQIVLSGSLVLGANFSCTLIRPRTATAQTITYRRSDYPVLVVLGANNVWVQGVNIKLGIDVRAGACASALLRAGRESNSIVCPAVYIANSYGIQINQGSVYGRIDVFRSVSVSLDHLTVTGAQIYLAGKVFTSAMTRGFIRIGETVSGDRLIGANIFVTNCEVYGGWELITLYRGAVGVTVSNNYLHDFLFVGVRVGADVGFVMDAHGNTISNNFIYNPPAYASSITDINNAGIYTCLHFFNPGNYISCNYIYNQRWCIYLDFTSSGVTIEGGMCNGSYAAVKVNGGKFNKVRSLIVVWSSRFLHFTSCVSVQFGNCFNPTGNNWEAIRRKSWNSSTINQRYRYMPAICNPIPTIINNIRCNTALSKFSASVTGHCSGYSYGNDVQSFWYYSSRKTGPYDYNSCYDDAKVNATTFNRERAFNVTNNPGFVGGGIVSRPADFGLRNDSRIYRIDPRFKSCSRSSVGPSTVTGLRDLASYRTFWNIRQPSNFNDVVSFDFGRILNQSLSVPTSRFSVLRTSLTVP